MLDLGCGDGALLALLRDIGCRGYGVELDDANGAGLRAARQRASSSTWKTARRSSRTGASTWCCSSTLQHLRNTENMLRETARVGRIGIVSFPNFAHWPNRLRVLGRMPVTKAALPVVRHANIRVGTPADFGSWRARTVCTSSTPSAARGVSGTALAQSFTSTAVFKFESTAEAHLVAAAPPGLAQRQIGTVQPVGNRFAPVRPTATPKLAVTVPAIAIGSRRSACQ